MTRLALRRGTVVSISPEGDERRTALEVEVAGERRPVQPGSIVFVAKAVAHRFVEIEEDLSILVFFAPEHRS